jgi:hypothetical protein
MSVSFPNVPNFPGVPQLARAAVPTPSSIAVTLGGAVLTALFGLVSTQSQWGIFDASGNAIFEPDSVLEFEHHPRWRISDFPVQGTGTTPTAFASYNKVKLPYDARVRMSKGSTLADRQTFLKALDAAANSIALYTILTPEYSYQNCDIEYYDVVRSFGEGAYFLTEVDVYFKQIVSVQAQYSTTTLQNASNPSALPQSVAGTVQLQPISLAAATQTANASLATAFGSF